MKKLENQKYHLFECDPTPPSEIARENVDADQCCKIVINELNTGSPGILQKMDFIELFVYCTTKIKSKSLQGFKIIGILAGSGRSDGMLIDLVVNLWNCKWNKENFFTIGTPEVQSTDLTTDSSYVTY